MKDNNQIYTCIDEETMLLIEAVLKNIRHKLNIAYWNKHQKEMKSPFDNTGETYENGTFSVSAYDWVNESGPNFKYKGFEVYWYKYMGRGMEYYCNELVTAEYIKKMHSDCIHAICGDENI